MVGLECGGGGQGGWIWSLSGALSQCEKAPVFVVDAVLGWGLDGFWTSLCSLTRQVGPSARAGILQVFPHAPL